MPSKKYEEYIALRLKKNKERLPGQHEGRDTNGKMLPGYSLNPAGKKKGTKNKITKKFRSEFNKLLEHYYENMLEEDFFGLKPVERIKMIIEISNSEIKEKIGKVKDTTSSSSPSNVVFEITYVDETKKRKSKTETIDISPKDYQVEDNKGSEEV